MTFTIHKGKHRAKPLYWLRWFALLINPKRIARRVTFLFDSTYSLEGEDQQDTNKLFGAAFGKVHRNSVRFGWRYNPDSRKFILSAYCYINGERIIEELCDCVANHYYDCEIWITELDYLFKVTNEKGQILSMTAISKGHRRKIGWLLGVYFGGNNPAPKRIELQLKK